MELEYERTLEKTPTWAVAVVCFVLLVISIFIEHVINFIGKWFKSRHKRALYEALEKLKSELMLLGFLSLLLTVLQDPIAGICIPKSVAATWHPCNDATSDSKARKLHESSDSVFSFRRKLATKGYDNCTENGKVAFVSAYGIHQLHVFIFVLAVFHVLYCITTLALGRHKMRIWKYWENETKTVEYQFSTDPERFRYARDTSFGRRHLNFWSQSPVFLWIVCFFRQFFRSVTKTDYLTLRHGFIMAHLAPGSETTFDFRKYISRSLEDDFLVIVEISPIIWFSAVLFLLSNAYGWYSYLWLPFISLFIILLVGTKLQVIITMMGMRIQERGGVVMGAPLVQPGDHYFWFGRPRFMLFLIHFVLFQNAFQLAFFAWSTWQFGIDSCFHQTPEDIAIRISMGVIIQVLCSYVTLPLYALVTQMGSSMKPTVFNEGVAEAVKSWHHKAKKKVKHSLHSERSTPLSSRPGTPTHGMSPVHLLHNVNNRSDEDDLFPPPEASIVVEMEHLDTEGSQKNNVGPSERGAIRQTSTVRELGQIHEPPAPSPSQAEHVVKSPSSFSFGTSRK
uniref:MLO-like protein n=1 Tax=Rosa multiflora TaxID=74647 RepID=K7X4S6_ROSMU|nr:MLO protein 3 [Rosa multiflora]